MDSEEWHLVQQLQSSVRSPLLVKARFDKDNYEIKATDLIQVWSESLDKSAITSRAHRLDCSIDPAEDASQLKVFLQKIEGAVLEREGTQMTATLDDVENCITLSVSSDLPKPLKPLRWSIYLRRLPSEAIRSEVIIPLMYGSFVRHKQVETLESLLRVKDIGIGRFADKVEGVGVDLSSLLLHAGTSRHAKKQMSRQQIFKHIHGLPKYDRRAWEEEWRADLRSAPSFAELALQSFGHSKPPPTQALLHDMQNPQGGHAASTRNEHASQSSLTLEEAQSQEFQTRTSPPTTRERLHRGGTEDNQVGKQISDDSVSAGLSKAEADDDETTEDEGEDHVQLAKDPPSLKTNEHITKDEASAEDTVVPREGSGARQERKLGRIGGTKTQTDKRTLIDDAQHNITANGNQEEAATLGSDNATVTTPKKKRLGVIGGKKAAEAASEDHIHAQEPAPSTTNTTSELNTTDQVDVGGGRVDSKDVPTSPPKEGVMEIPQTLGNSVTPEAEEDPQEKANRKRQELKRDLETRTKQTPKKKRKF